MAVKMSYVVVMCKRGVLNSKNKHFLSFFRSPILSILLLHDIAVVSSAPLFRFHTRQLVASEDPKKRSILRGVRKKPVWRSAKHSCIN